MFILLELYNIFIFSYTNSRAGFLMASLLVLCVWAIKSKVIYKIFKSFGKSFAETHFTDRETAEGLDELHPRGQELRQVLR